MFCKYLKKRCKGNSLSLLSHQRFVFFVGQIDDYMFLNVRILTCRRQVTFLTKKKAVVNLSFSLHTLIIILYVGVCFAGLWRMTVDTCTVCKFCTLIVNKQVGYMYTMDIDLNLMSQESG